MAQTVGDDPHHERADLAMVQTAIRNEFEISAEMRKKAVEQVYAIINDPNAKQRAKLSATRTLASLVKLNLEATSVLRDNKPQVVVVQNNTTNVDTLAQVVDGFKDPADAQRFLELIAKSDYRPDNADAARSTPTVAGGAKGNAAKL